MSESLITYLGAEDFNDSLPILVESGADSNITLDGVSGLSEVNGQPVVIIDGYLRKSLPKWKTMPYDARLACLLRAKSVIDKARKATDSDRHELERDNYLDALESDKEDVEETISFGFFSSLFNSAKKIIKQVAEPVLSYMSGGLPGLATWGVGKIAGELSSSAPPSNLGGLTNQNSLLRKEYTKRMTALKRRLASKNMSGALSWMNNEWRHLYNKSQAYYKQYQAIPSNNAGARAQKLNQFERSRFDYLSKYEQYETRIENEFRKKNTLLAEYKVITTKSTTLNSIVKELKTTAGSLAQQETNTLHNKYRAKLKSRYDAFQAMKKGLSGSSLSYYIRYYERVNSYYRLYNEKMTNLVKILKAPRTRPIPTTVVGKVGYGGMTPPPGMSVMTIATKPNENIFYTYMATMYNETVIPKGLPSSEVSLAAIMEKLQPEAGVQMLRQLGYDLDAQARLSMPASFPTVQPLKNVKRVEYDNEPKPRHRRLGYTLSQVGPGTDDNKSEDQKTSNALVAYDYPGFKESPGGTVTSLVPSEGVDAFEGVFDRYYELADRYDWVKPIDLIRHADNIGREMDESFQSCSHDANVECDHCVTLARDFSDERSLMPKGRFFETPLFTAELTDLPKGQFGMVDHGSEPFRIYINRKVVPQRQAISLAHEAMHVLNKLLKLNIPHENIHSSAIFLVNDVIPAILALRALQGETNKETNNGNERLTSPRLHQSS